VRWQIATFFACVVDVSVSVQVSLPVVVLLVEADVVLPVEDVVELVLLVVVLVVEPVVLVVEPVVLVVVVPVVVVEPVVQSDAAIFVPPSTDAAPMPAMSMATKAETIRVFFMGG
jgi:hypothetical protein